MRSSRSLSAWLKADWVLLAGVALLVVFTVGLTREIVRRRAVGQEIAELQREVQRLRDRRSELQQLVAEFQSPEAQEREARTKLNLGQPGEKAVIIEWGRANAGTNASPSAALVADAATASADSNPHKWWNYFFGT